MCFITQNISWSFLLAFNGDTIVGIAPISGTMTFCDYFCFETSKSNILFGFNYLIINIERKTIRICL